MTSWALWLPLLWLMIIEARSVSFWLGIEDELVSADSSLDGTPLDRNIFLALMIAGAVVLWKRKIDWSRIIRSNRWLFIFFLYFGLSVIWSDYPFVSFKRWTKDLGNVIMVLIILSESDRLQAIKAVFARYTYFAVITSVLLIIYFPDLGISYDRWTEEPAYLGITTNKNHLGMVLTICGLFLVWDLLETRFRDSLLKDKAGLMVRAMLFVMLAWLLMMAGSATALVCLTSGACILIFIRIPFVQRQFRYLGVYSLATILVAVSILVLTPTVETIVKLLGRDLSFTGRTEIWTDLLRENVNPILGTGYMSFWLGSAVDRYDNITQAHNGYLETYLNGGLIGLCLLTAVIIFTGSKMKKELLYGTGIGTLLICFLFIAVIYNLTEAMFNRLSVLWFVLLIAGLYYPLPEPMNGGTAKRGVA